MDMPVFDHVAACSKTDPEIFFPEDNNDRQAFLIAKTICDSCLNSEKCLEYAVSNPTLEGIWAGTTKRMRDRLRNSLRRSGRRV